MPPVAKPLFEKRGLDPPKTFMKPNEYSSGGFDEILSRSFCGKGIAI